MRGIKLAAERADLLAVTRTPKPQRGASLTGYALVLATFVAGSLAVLDSLETASGDYLHESGQTIGRPMEGREYFATTMFGTTPDWASTLPGEVPTTLPMVTEPPPSEVTTVPSTTIPEDTTPGEAGPPSSESEVVPAFLPYIVNATATVGSTEKCLEAGAGGSLSQQTCNTTKPNQRLTVNINATGDWQVTVSEQCFAPQNSSTQQETPIVAVDCDDNDPFQVWVRDGLRLMNKATNMCLDVKGNSPNNGAILIQWPCHTQANQQFSFNP